MPGRLYSTGRGFVLRGGFLYIVKFLILGEISSRIVPQKFEYAMQRNRRNLAYMVLFFQRHYLKQRGKNC